MGNGSGLSLLAVNTDNVRKMMEDMGGNCALIVELAFANGHAKAGLEAMRDGWCSQNGAAAVDEAVTLFENITKKTVTSYRTMVFQLVDFSEKRLNLLVPSINEEHIQTIVMTNQQKLIIKLLVYLNGMVQI